MDEDRVRQIIQRLRNRDKKGELEVEHILNLVRTGDAALVDPLRELSAASGWIGLNEELFVPMATWVEIVCEYFECGITRMEQIVLRKDEYSTFALSVLETLHNQESAEALVRSLSALREALPESVEYLREAVRIFNLVVSCGKDVPLPEPEPERQSAKACLQAILTEADALGDNELIVDCMYAYRGIGDEETIFHLKQWPSLPPPYRDTVDMVVKRIRKRIAKQNRL